MTALILVGVAVLSILDWTWIIASAPEPGGNIMTLVVLAAALLIYVIDKDVTEQ